MAMFRCGGGNAQQSDVTAQASDVLNPKTIIDRNGNLVTGTIYTASGGTYTPTTYDRVVAEAGEYLGGDIRLRGDANLIANNIAQGKTIFNVNGACPRYGHKSETVTITGTGAPVENVYFTRAGTSTTDQIRAVILSNIEFTPTHASIWCWITQSGGSNIIKLAETYSNQWMMSDKSVQYSVSGGGGSNPAAFSAARVTLPIPWSVTSDIDQSKIYYTVTGYYAS